MMDSLPPQDQLQTIILDDVAPTPTPTQSIANLDESTSKSYSSYKSAMSTLTPSSFHHPLSTPADSDPLLSPPHPPSDTSVDYKHCSKSLSDYSQDTFIGFKHGSKSLSDCRQDISVAYNHGSKLSSDYSQEDSSNSNYLKISVTDPKKEGTKNSYVTYLITTETDLSDFNGSKFSVRRRFKDIVTLSDLLNEAYRGYFIPPRPDKSVVESQVMQKQEFVEQRRLALERYLRRLAAHEVIKRSDELRVFLQDDGKMGMGMGTETDTRMGVGDVVQKGKSGRDLMRLFKELKQTVAVDWGGAKAPMEEEDGEFLEKKEKLNQLELQLSNASKQAESLVKAQQKMGETLGELGLAFMKLTKFENEHATLVTQKNRAIDMKSIATAAVKAGRLYRGLNAQSVNHLDTLHEYMGLMLAARNAFSDRSSALLTAQTLISELCSMHAKAGKLETTSSKIFGGDKLRPRKLEEFKEAIRVTEDAKCCALKEYERIKENNRNEIERLDRERKDDFVNMLKGFVTSQVTYAEKIETEWSKVAEETSRYAKGSE